MKNKIFTIISFLVAASLNSQELDSSFDSLPDDIKKDLTEKNENKYST